ncbi:hypothetical protein [Aquimarina pacifica]|uniref:hypothetical protein n=1 Tax=Aquimarina pacifica TaxID=1296415 RepID=UPI00046FDAF4|nr:hypothetical protein [Aquimarina pacifica]
MKIKAVYTIFLFVALLILYVLSAAFTNFLKTEESVTAKLVTKETVFKAGNEIQLTFELNAQVFTELLLHYSYGTVLISSDLLDKPKFSIPEFIVNKKGMVSYTLFYESKNIYQSQFFIEANTTTPVQLESYIGPPSIIAGGNDYTMHVVVPTDTYDNPLPDSTAVILKHQFLDIVNERQVSSKDMLGWEQIFSYEESGQLLLSSQVKETYSKEHAIKVFPAFPEDFTISYMRKHRYADGNQVINFKTSIVNDQYGNSISDGTMVNFIVKNSSGKLLHTQGTIINGSAVAKMLHPDHEDTWEVKAYVYGMGESDKLSLSFAKVLEDFDVNFGKGNREIIVGPLKSFMGQLIPDGAMVKLDIYRGNKKIETKSESSSRGMVRFLLEEGFFGAGNYSFKIGSMGVHKEYDNIVIQ